MKRDRVTAADGADRGQIDGVTDKETDQLASRLGHDPRSILTVTQTTTITELRRPLTAIALYAVGFAGLMLLLNPLHLAGGSEWLPHLARVTFETVCDLPRSIANALT
jgi:hypothetical protein